MGTLWDFPNKQPSGLWTTRPQAKIVFRPGNPTWEMARRTNFLMACQSGALTPALPQGAREILSRSIGSRTRALHQQGVANFVQTRSCHGTPSPRLRGTEAAGRDPRQGRGEGQGQTGPKDMKACPPHHSDTCACSAAVLACGKRQRDTAFWQRSRHHPAGRLKSSRAGKRRGVRQPSPCGLWPTGARIRAATRIPHPGKTLPGEILLVAGGHVPWPLLVTQVRPLILGNQCLSQIVGRRQNPLLRTCPAGGMMAYDFLQPAAHYFRKAHLILSRQALGLAK